MKSTQQQIAETGIVYETYWDSYLAGDVDTFASTLDDHFKMIGTTENEVCDDKAGGIDFCKSQLYEPRLAVRNLRKGDSVTIEIEDNGPGIPDEIKDKILQPFFTTKKGTADTGLGLSITNDIIKAHGGQLGLSTEMHKGSCFTIQLSAT